MNTKKQSYLSLLILGLLFALSVVTAWGKSSHPVVLQHNRTGDIFPTVIAKDKPTTVNSVRERQIVEESFELFLPILQKPIAYNVEFIGHIGGVINAVDVVVVGDYAYLADPNAGLHVIDISNPANPSLVGSLNFGYFGFPHFVEVAGNFAYLDSLVGIGVAGMKRINVSDPTNPILAGEYISSDVSRAVAVAGAYIYVADGWGGLQVVDVSDPVDLVKVGSLDINDAYDVVVEGDYAYVADWWYGLRVIDISDPVKPSEVGYYQSGFAHGVAVSGDYVYFINYYERDHLDYSRVRVINVSDPASPSEVGFYNSPGDILGLVAVGGNVYLADGISGLRVLDVSDPSNPFEVGYYNTPGVAKGVVAIGSFVLVADGPPGLIILKYTGN